ncbi:mediator of RNA polymerase II transcription subunit 23-like [Impatiens glandulifera]|uniref:mediator of RNA polymerase II transcription subunit 23-like n=1 Tax=Impatiens glandulifera TaxID=253017 RepID=UPI001FB05CFF|nr:mediator of RNA polymerase II transcription subunit 23-like [Impatiens glandulifera]
MDRNQQQRASRAHQLHPARAAITDLFNLYLGRTTPSTRQKPDDSIREPPNKTQRRVTALNRDLPPPNEQFLLDFQQLQNKFPEKEQLQNMTESVLISLLIQRSSHVPQAEFLLFALHSLCSVGYINWDTILPSLLSSVSSTNMSIGQGSQSTAAMPQSGMLPHSSTLNATSKFQQANPTSPMHMVQGVGSPDQSANEPSSCAILTPMKLSDAQQSISNLRQLCCKIILTGLQSNLKPASHAEILNHMLNWLVNWDQRQQGVDDVIGEKVLKLNKALTGWLHSCLDIIWLLVEDDECRVPFYELLRSGLQFLVNIPEDESLFTLILEIHRRRDMMATHMQMLDQHLHCPTFATPRFQFQINMSGEVVTNMRFSPITYPSVLGEPLHGEDLAASIQRGTLDWERPLRCLRHALRMSPSADWWKRVVVAFHRTHAQVPISGAVFTSEMLCEAIIDRIVELLKLTNSEINCWQEWLIFSDTFYFLIKNGCIDFVDFVDKLALRFAENEQGILRSNHVAWLLVLIIRLELVTNALNTDSRKVETTQKIMSFLNGDRTADPNIPQNILLDFISSCLNLRIWAMNAQTRDFSINEHLHKGKQIDEWWRKTNKREPMLDYMNLDNKSVGMFWVLSYTMEQPAYETVMSWLTSAGISELLPTANSSPNEKMMVMREVSPPPVALLSGLSINLCMKLAAQLEESMFGGQVIPSIATVETYARLLILMPNSLFRHQLSHLSKNPSPQSKSGTTVLILEILNYRLLPLYRYNGKSKTLLYELTKLVSLLKGKRGDHRIFRLVENLCMNLILSIREFFFVKKEGKGPTEFTETLNRITITSFAIIIKTRGIAEQEHLLYLPTMLEQILANCQHTWSEKTLRHFPTILREALSGRIDKRGLSIHAWQQVETTVINQCKQLLSPSADPTYVLTYIGHSFPQHRQYLCAGAWVLMRGHPENINNSNLVRVLREISSEEVTANIYTMVDVLLYHMQLELQNGHSLKDLLLQTSNNLAYFVWNSELLLLDILLLALIDRDDDPHALHIAINLLERQELQQRIKSYIVNCGPSEHWLYAGNYKRVEVEKALGTNLSWKEVYPTFFDDIAARLFPVLPLIIYRLIENDATDSADRILQLYSTFLRYYPFNFTFVRDILAYFYGHLPAKLILRILNILDPKRIPFSESFSQHVNLSNGSICPPFDYFTTLLLGLVNNVIPSVNNISKSGLTSDASSYVARAINNKISSAHGYEGQKQFYQIQDPGTNTQLVLDTAVIEILSLSVPTSQIVSALVHIVSHIQSILIQSKNGLHGAPTGPGSILPISPSGGSTDSMSANRSVSGVMSSSFVSRSGYTRQQLSCLIIQAGGLLLAQLPPEFHVQLYAEVSRLIKKSWWLTDGNRSLGELNSAVDHALLDPSWAAQDSTSTTIGNIVGLLHAFFYNLPLEWLEGSHLIIKHLRPVTSVALLRIVFRIISPLLPRLIDSQALFNKTLSLLLGVLVDVFGKNSPSTPVNASAITDIIDFLHHIIHYEGESGPVQANSKPRPEVLTLFGRALESLRPDVQHLLSHLKPDANSSIYAPRT